MSLADWDVSAIVMISVWSAILGLFINFYIIGQPDSAIGMWIAVLGGFGLVYVWHTYFLDSETPESIDTSDWK